MDDEMNIGKKKVVVGGIWEAVRHRFCLAFLSLNTIVLNLHFHVILCCI